MVGQGAERVPNKLFCSPIFVGRHPHECSVTHYPGQGLSLAGVPFLGVYERP
jgi:hypothetical protein